MSKVLSVRLSDDATRAFEEQVAAAGVGKAEYLTRLILAQPARSGAPDVEKLLRSARPSLAPIPEPDPEREAEAIRARASRKAARAERKAELAEAITSALPVQVRPEAAPVARPHNFHSGVSPVAGCDVCAAAAEAYKGTG